ncbi:MAG TPA: mandelate racemase/muconate lactonizing enzyme family protein [Chloroflexota bacterium]|nr:mandelate racemase/muconate lactonizing enzyme family protein [Chloroflexota bacterium]
MAMQIARVESFRFTAQRDYEGSAGLRPATVAARPGAMVLDQNTGRHLCVYPARAEVLLVRIVTDDGLVGWGEAHSPPIPRVAQTLIAELLAPQLIGRDPLAIDAIWDGLYASMRLRGYGSGVMLEALAGVDIALWDLAGKALGVPVYTLLGGPYRTRLPCYASGVPGATVQERIATARRYVELGYTALKTSIGRGSLEEDLVGVEALAEAVRGRARVLVDAHGCFDARTATTAGRRLERTGVGWLEDPFPPEDVDGYAALCAALDLPVASGETECTRWQFNERLRRKAADVILPDVCRAGGISEGRKIALVADLHNVPWCVHASISTALHLAAGLHLGAATPNFLLCEYPSAFVLGADPLGNQLLAEPIRYEGGHLEVPSGPGLGLTFDEAALAAHALDPYQPVA